MSTQVVTTRYQIKQFLVYTAEDIIWGLQAVSEGTKAFLNISGPSQVCLEANTS